MPLNTIKTINGINFFINTESLLFFQQGHGNNLDRTLWRSDGTEEGTFPLVFFDGSILSDDSHSDTIPIVDGNIFDTTQQGIDGKLFFRASNNEFGSEIWISDGTTEGTRILKDINPVGSSDIDNLTDVNGTLFFSNLVDTNDNGALEAQLWKSDGTTEGTQLVVDSFVEPSRIQNFIDFNGTLFFTTNSVGRNNVDLWKSNGTTVNTQSIFNFDDPNGSTVTVNNLTVAESNLFFTTTIGFDGTLWVTDGTIEGTRAILNDQRLPTQADAPYLGVGNTLFFVYDNGETGAELWKSDGTTEGTQLIKDIRSEERQDGVPINNGSNIQNLVDVDGTLFFTADSDGNNLDELWKSDGTEEGTQLFLDTTISFTEETTNGTVVGVIRDFDFLVNVDGILYFTRTLTLAYNNGAITSNTGSQLWRTDGTEEGTFAINPETFSFAGSEESNELFDDLIEFQDELFLNKTITFPEPSNNTSELASFGGRNLEEPIDPEPTNTLELFRFRNTTFGSGTYVFVGEGEREFIQNDENLSNTFSLDGVGDDGTINSAFKASTESADGLIPFFRLKSLVVPGTFLFVSTAEYNAIFADDSNQQNQWEKEGLNDDDVDIPEFYLLDGSANEGTAFNRFQNTQNGTFLYAGPGETEAIENDPNLSGLFINQGVAFNSLA